MTTVMGHMYRMATVCSFLALNTFFGACNGNVIVYPVNASATSFRDRPATFGNVIAQNGLSGGLVVANPLNACVPIKSPPKQMEMIGQFFALIEESSCDFSTQVLNAEEANYEAAIIYNRYSDDLKVMDAGKDGHKVSIPSVFVGRFTGVTLKKYTYDTRASVLITAFNGPSLLIYLIPFVIVVGLCFLFMAIFTIIRYYRHRVHVRRSRLTPANLKKIPCKKFKKGDDYDICAICLDDYEEGDKLRVLPCHHVYHCKCVDPWLLEGKRTCPVCKQPVQLDRSKRRSACTRSYSSVVSTSAEEMNNETENGDDDENDNNFPSERTPLIQGNRSARDTGIHV